MFEDLIDELSEILRNGGSCDDCGSDDIYVLDEIILDHNMVDDICLSCKACFDKRFPSKN
jgi:hypothetical protein